QAPELLPQSLDLRRIRQGLAAPGQGSGSRRTGDDRMTWLTLPLVRFLLAGLVLALFGGALIILSFVLIPEANRDVVIQLVGGINSLAGMVVGFYFGNMEGKIE